MRILRRFTSADLEATSGISRVNALSFITSLRRAGYLAVVGVQMPAHAAPPSNVYQLARDTGPLSPIERKCGQVFDANLKQTFCAEPKLGRRVSRHARSSANQRDDVNSETFHGYR
jgi:hypothetical protein